MALATAIIRVVLFVFSVIALGLTAAWVVDTDSSRVRFAVFSAAFSILFGCFYGFAAEFIDVLAFPIAMVIIDFLNWVFLFAGATAIAAKNGAGSCSNESNLKNHFGDDPSSGACRMAQAGCAFLYFSWFAAVVLFVYSVLGMINSGNFGVPARKSVPRTGVPTMSQI